MSYVLCCFAAISVFIAFKAASGSNAGWKIWMVPVVIAWLIIGALYGAANYGYRKS